MEEPSVRLVLRKQMSAIWQDAKVPIFLFLISCPCHLIDSLIKLGSGQPSASVWPVGYNLYYRQISQISSGNAEYPSVSSWNFGDCGNVRSQNRSEQKNPLDFVRICANLFCDDDGNEHLWDALYNFLLVVWERGCELVLSGKTWNDLINWAWVTVMKSIVFLGD